MDHTQGVVETIYRDARAARLFDDGLRHPVGRSGAQMWLRKIGYMGTSRRGGSHYRFCGIPPPTSDISGIPTNGRLLPNLDLRHKQKKILLFESLERLTRLHEAIALRRIELQAGSRNKSFIATFGSSSAECRVASTKGESPTQVLLSSSRPPLEEEAQALTTLDMSLSGAINIMFPTHEL